MFEKLARVVTRYKGWVVAGWLLLALFMLWQAPRLSQVGEANELAFLPPDAPSMQAQRVLEQTFPDLASGVDVLLVFHRPTGLTQADRDYIREVTQWLTSDNAPEDVRQATSVFDHPELEPLLVSQDEQVMLVQVDLKSEPYSDQANRAVEALREHLHATQPQGLAAYVTGQAAIGRDFTHHILRSVDKTTWATIVLVVAILLFVYRAPLAAGVPLVTIGTAYIITRGLLGYMAQAGWLKISSMVDAFIVVLIFGVGTDYALFLISRYREEVARRPNHDREAADRETVVRIGPVLTASAATVIIGTLGMTVARFEMIRTQGPAMALGIAVALLASLTLTPALLSLLGAHLFWPFHRRIQERQEEHRSRFWEAVADLMARHPAWTTLLVTGLLLVPYLFLPKMVRTLDILQELPADVESRQGFEVLKAHFPAGELMPVVVVLQGNADLSTPQGLARIAAVQEALEAVPGVAQVRSVVKPTGGEQPDKERLLHAQEQLRLLAESMTSQPMDLSPEALSQVEENFLPRLDTLQAYLDELAQAFPQVTQDPAYDQALESLVTLRREWHQLQEQMQVAYQLNLLVRYMQEGTPSSGMPQGNPEQAGQALQVLAAYLEELQAAYPEVAQDPGYQQTLKALQTLQQAQEQAQQMNRVSVQLHMLAQGLRQAATQPSQSTSGPGDMAASLAALGNYLQALAQAHPEVQGQPAFQDAVARLQALQGLMAQAPTDGVPSPQALQALQQQVNALADDLDALAQAVDPTATLPPTVLMDLPQARTQQEALQQAQTDLTAGLEALARRFARRDARLLPQSLARWMAGNPQEGPAARMEQALADLADALNRLADALPERDYFLPQSLLAQQDGQQLLDVFLADNRRAAMMQVLLEGDPYSNAAMDAVRTLRATAHQAAQEQGLRAAVAGPSVQFAEVRQFMNEDFPRVMAVVVAGVFMVFVLLLGSLVAPVYLVTSVMLSYGTSMGLVTWLFQDVLGHAGVAYDIPLVIFVLLVALGADYNIFLTSRIWEEAAKGGDVREGVRRASAFTGGVITSAGLILAGTFAALMLSTLQSMFQIGAAVALGVLLDTFVVRALLVPAIAALLGRWNWWPARRPMGHGGVFRQMFRNKAQR